MAGKLVYDGTNPKTQSIDGVKSLLAFVGRSSDPLPSDVSLDNGRVVLILSNKRDCYYVATAAKCSCPARTWHPGQTCKHQRKYFPVAKVEQSTASEPLIKRGGFKPFSLLPSEERRAAELA